MISGDITPLEFGRRPGACRQLRAVRTATRMGLRARLVRWVRRSVPRDNHDVAQHHRDTRSWELQHDQYTPEGQIELAGRFADGWRRDRRRREVRVFKW